MAKTAAQLAAEAYEKQKRQNRYGTTSGGAVTKTNPVDASKQAAQIYQQQKNSGIYQTTSGGTVKSTSKSIGSSGGSRTIPRVTMPIIKTATIPTKKYSPVRPTPNPDVSGIDQSKVAANAYKQKMSQYRQSMGYDDEESTKKTQNAGNRYSGPTAMGTFSDMLTPKLPDVEVIAAAEERTPKFYNGYGQYMLPSENYAAKPAAVDGSAQAAANANPYATREGTTLRRTQSNPNSSETFGLALDPNYEYKTYSQQKAEAEAARKEQERAYQQWLAQQQTVEQPVLEEVAEEELDPMEEYWQAIIDAQNAQYAAMNQALRNQQVGLNGLYDQNAADLYAQYVRSGLVLPEQMAGMSTGAADSLMLQNDLNYQNNLNKNELERIAGLADLESQMAQNQAEADLQAAETAAEWAKMAYQQRLAEQKAAAKNTGGSKTSGKTSGNKNSYEANTLAEVKQYLQLQLGMGNNMTAENIKTVLMDMYNAGAISKQLAKDAAKQYGFTLYL